MLDLTKANIIIDRKIMAYLIVNKPESFNAIFDKIK